MLSGGHFVEAMARLGYPDAASLEPSEFDWMFNGSPENLHFLRFVCQSLNQSNVLTTEEVRAYGELQKSGVPILDQAALDKVLKTIGPFKESSSAEECVTVEDLEGEFQALMKEKALKQQRLKRLQAVAASGADVDLRLASELERAASQLKEASASLEAENANTNAELQSLADKAGELTSWHLSVGPEAAHASAGRKREPLLSQLSLNQYLRQEELNTKTLAAFARNHFFADLVDTSSSSEGFQGLDLSSCQEKEEDKKKSEAAQKRTHVARLELVHITTQHQLMQATAEEASVKAGRDWLSEKLPSVQQRIAKPASLRVREVASRMELQAVEAEMEVQLHGPVPPVLRESARLFVVPVLKADLALQLALQSHLASQLDEVRDHLLRQKASFDVLHLAQQIDLREWRACLNHLANANSRLVEERDATSLRLGALAHPELALNTRPNPIVTSKDAAFRRLLRLLLEHHSSRGRVEPFQTYEALKQAACGLANDLQASHQALTAASRDQDFTVAQVQGHCQALREAVSSEFQELRVSCPVATADRELLCPHAQELMAKLREAKSCLERLQEAVHEIKGKINTKHLQLECNSLLRHERELYIRFHLDVQLLQSALEDLERRRLLRSRRE
ncbi:HAUS augmin-like complex subunit 3 isoform X1 [Syngnathus typhle]|uniref:HAUS augmin-like complex subunit 3 isoform X1 n=1 Tax=Syngnathus typhle TaxID=161592 RepID=UPI002A6AF136|nr:HAUS augmin-like complex subunit 3 isoform X1 [Syngnathus typhle]XP_061133554.1 HAUS augmin-like complex subunit 3 isoform X1 [Syngnathus typhle]